MNLFEAMFLGLVQGLTEFIPISSSGHLVLAQRLLGHESSHLFLEAINIGTFVALLVYFLPKIIEIVKDVLVNKNFVLARNILLTSIPAGLVGFALADFIDRSPLFGSVYIVVITLLIVGVAMVVLDWLPKLSAKGSGSALSANRALIIGGAQMLALIPGVSRSGSTIVTGRLMGLSSKAAAEYSFLASLPIMAGVTAKVIISDHHYLLQNAVPLIAGNVVAFISGLIAVKFLITYLSQNGLAVFGWYRIILAVIVLGIALI